MMKYFVKSKGELNAIRKSGSVPAIIYGGKEANQKIAISKCGR